MTYKELKQKISELRCSIESPCSCCGIAAMKDDPDGDLVSWDDLELLLDSLDLQNEVVA